MTFAVGTVQGGTRAGWRIVKPKPEEWLCQCPSKFAPAVARRSHPAYMARCPDCGTRRPS